MRKEIGILLAWVVFLSGCVGKPMEKQNEQTKKEDAVLRLYTLKENENLWQSAKLFMEKYPKYPVDRGGDIRGRRKDGIRCNPKSEHRDYGGKWTGYHFDGWTSN